MCCIMTCVLYLHSLQIYNQDQTEEKFAGNEGLTKEYPREGSLTELLQPPSGHRDISVEGPCLTLNVMLNCENKCSEPV